MAPIERRLFLRVAVVAAGAAAMPFGWTRTAQAAGTAVSKLTRSSFTKYVGSTFRMSSGTFAGDVVLSSVEDIAGAPAGDQNRYALLFRAPASSTTAPQGVYTFRQSSFGSADLLAVPVDRGKDARYYQAIVNRTT